MEAKKIDFLVIGAAKSATTTLYELIRKHPQIFIPAAKEVPFFSDDKVYAKGMDRYLRTYFGNADTKKLWGTVTPHYMLGQEDTSPQIVADRIRSELPNVKLIALLRDPVERAFSHYKMSLQLGYETRCFEDIVMEVLKCPDAFRNKIKPDLDYIFGGEYGRILNYYFTLFPSKNILLLTTDELQMNSLETVRSIFSFLNIDPDFTPNGPHKTIRQGGSKPKVRLLTPGILYKIPLLEYGWKNLVPHPLRIRIGYYLNLWNVKPDNDGLDKQSEAYENLVRFYAKDYERLEHLAAKKMPWAQIFNKI